MIEPPRERLLPRRQVHHGSVAHFVGRHEVPWVPVRLGLVDDAPDGGGHRPGVSHSDAQSHDTVMEARADALDGVGIDANSWRVWRK